jgi:uncharacterized protein (DUF1330 family)
MQISSTTRLTPGARNMAASAHSAVLNRQVGFTSAGLPRLVRIRQQLSFPTHLAPTEPKSTASRYQACDCESDLRLAFFRKSPLRALHHGEVFAQHCHHRAKITVKTKRRRYAEEAPKSLIPFNGRYVVRGEKVQALESDAPKGYIAVLGFDSVERAREWYYSRAYEAIKPIRQNTTMVGPCEPA